MVNKKRMKEKKISNIIQNKLEGAEIEISSSERDFIDDERSETGQIRDNSSNKPLN